MAKRKSSKIFIKNGDSLKVLMWVIEGSDGSVMMGFPWESEEAIALVMDEDLGDLRKEDLVTEGFTGKSKISFHPSGQFKFNCRMGVNQDSIDRVTVKGPSFQEITTQQRLAEILLPKILPNSHYLPTDKDIVINITNAETQPTRCTISCVCNEEFKKIKSTNSRVVDTSEWEATHALKNDSHTWIWTIRRSKNDKSNADKIYVTLLGSPKWGVE